MRLRYVIACIGFLFLIGEQIFPQSYEIDVKISGLSDTTVILGHHFNKSMYPDDTVMLNSKGFGTLKGDTLLKGGLYFLYIPAKNVLTDFLIDGTDQKFSIEASADNFTRSVQFRGSTINEHFSAYQKFLVDKRTEAEPLSDSLKNTDSEELKKALRDQLQKISEEVEAYQQKIISSNRDNFLSVFLEATKEIEVPDPPVNEQGEIIDSNFQYNYYRNHYFDYFDLSDARLLYTPFYEQKLMTFLDKVIPQTPDTIIHYTDKFINQARSDKELFRYMLITLFNHYAQSKYMGHDAVYIHIADKYYIDEAYWSDSAFIADLKERVDVNKPLLIGKKAPDFEVMLIDTEHFIEAMSDTAAKAYPHAGHMITMHKIKSKYLVLAFWESDCSHCKKEIPALYKAYPDLKNYGVEVLAIHTLGGVEGKEKWIDFVNKNQLYDWMNSWNPYDYTYKKLYDIKTTPRLFLLDSEKRIVAKRIGVEQLIDIVEFEAEKNKE